MEKDIGNFFEWCEDRGKSTASLCRMSDDEIRGSELYGEYTGHLMLIRDYFGIGADENDENYSQYRQIRDDCNDMFKTTGLDYIALFLLLLGLIVLFLGCGGIFD